MVHDMWVRFQKAHANEVGAQENNRSSHEPEFFTSSYLQAAQMLVHNGEISLVVASSPVQLVN